MRLSASKAGPRREETGMRIRLALIALVALTACGSPSTRSASEPSDGCDPASCVTLPNDASTAGESRAAAADSDDETPLDTEALRVQALGTDDTVPTLPGDTVPGDTVPADTAPGDTVPTIPTVPGDTVPPDPIVDPAPGGYTISNVSVPSSVTAGNTITFQWTVTDPDGVEVTTARVGGPPGWVTWCPFPMMGTRISGDELSGTFRASCDVPANAPNTTYTVFFMSDGAAGLDVQRDFVVTGGSTDTGAPSITELSAPATASLGDSITITWRAADPSGVKYSFVWFANGGFGSSNGVAVVDYGDYGVTRLSGDEFDGVYSQTVRFRDDSPTGTYTLWVSRADLPGNKVFDDTPVRITVSG
ncbi:unannotated protein [freshwater metagenome]|uniref:Unannotated protein n=1 Tax=freshwater metagenome TaxID=449393 RepID=A0A6J6S0W8_9ZZZZ